MFKNIIDFVIEKYMEGNVRVHISQIDYPENQKYDTVMGVYLNGELIESFELEYISNKEIGDLKVQLQDTIRRNTLYLI